MTQPAQVAFKEGAQVWDAVFQHRQPVDPDAKGKALILLGVDPARSDHLRVHHAGAEDLHPVVTFTDFQLAIVPATADVDLCGWLGEGEVRRAETQFHLVHLEEALHELLKHPFEVRHGDVFIQRQPFDLMEHRCVSLVVIGAINTAGADDAQRRAQLLHGADLHGAGMRAQHMRRTIVSLGTVHVKRIHLGAGRVMAGDIQRVKVIPIGIDAGAFLNGESHFGKDRGQLF